MEVDLELAGLECRDLASAQKSMRRIVCGVSSFSLTSNPLVDKGPLLVHPKPDIPTHPLSGVFLTVCYREEKQR